MDSQIPAISSLAVPSNVGASTARSRSPSNASTSSNKSLARRLSRLDGRSLSRQNSTSKIQPELGSRWSLHLQAYVWRFLANIGAWLGQIPTPVPPQPSFTRQCSTHDVSKQEAATIELAFYVHDDYAQRIREGEKYPVVVNLHGGGFTLGTAKDDARWAAVVLEQTSAIFVSVEYRLAPEFPFPVGLEDGVEALLHLAAHSNEYGIDPHRIALSGFSAGGNMAFTIPLRLQTHLHSIEREVAFKSHGDSAPSEYIIPRVVSIIAWYPPLDQRLTRAERRATCSRPDMTLPDILTTLFDEAWLSAADDKSSPFASPAAATDEALQMALPHNIAMFLCEWDMLLQEGSDFYERLTRLGKSVRCTLIKESRHAFDKSPYPFSVDPKIALHYGEACEVLREAFGDHTPGSESRGLEPEAPESSATVSPA